MTVPNGEGGGGGGGGGGRVGPAHSLVPSLVRSASPTAVSLGSGRLPALVKDLSLGDVVTAAAAGEAEEPSAMSPRSGGGGGGGAGDEPLSPLSPRGGALSPRGGALSPRAGALSPRRGSPQRGSPRGNGFVSREPLSPPGASRTQLQVGWCWLTVDTRLALG